MVAKNRKDTIGLSAVLEVNFKELEEKNKSEF
jgi:hypothetical protein